MGGFRFDNPERRENKRTKRPLPGKSNIAMSKTGWCKMDEMIAKRTYGHMWPPDIHALMSHLANKPRHVKHRAQVAVIGNADYTPNYVNGRLENPPDIKRHALA